MKLSLPLVSAFLLATITAFGQQYTNLSYTPAQPKPGDIIRFEYSPAGTVLGESKDFEATAFLQDGQVRAQEIVLSVKGDKWVGEILTNDSTKVVLLVFKKDELTDNNREQGYSIMLMKNDQPVKRAYIALAETNSMGGFLMQMKVTPQQNVELYEKDFARDPELMEKSLSAYAGLLMRVDKEKAAQKLEPLIKALLAKKDKTESDYMIAMSAYTSLKDKTSADNLKAEILRKFPEGMQARSDKMNGFFGEADLKKKEALLDAFLLAYPVKTESDKRTESSLYGAMANAAAVAKDWELMKKYTAKVKDKESLANIYNEVAWILVGEGLDGVAGDLEMAKDLSGKSLAYLKEAKELMTNKPSYMTKKSYQSNLDYSYGNMMDTYALIMWKIGDASKAYEYQKEAVGIMKMGNVEANERYIMFKEKALGPESVKTEVEDFIRNGKSSPKLKDLLKRIYLTQNHSEEEYTVYMDGLMKEFREKTRAELLKKMISEAAPQFALKDISGKSVSLNDMKGKVVVVDFWATWCGPCRASFPGMQLAVDKYKDDPAVKFVFVDSWENKKPDEIQKNADEFIKKNKYSFQVLLDNDDKVIQSYAVEGIPTKFVIDPQSRIRFKAVGFAGNTDQLLDEMTIMIETLKSGANSDRKGF